MHKQDKQSEMPSTSQSCKKWLIWAIAIFAFIGFIDTAYLTANHFAGTAVNCSIVEGCNEVLSSKYSSILGIPLSLLGLMHYTVMLILALYYMDNKKLVVLKTLTFLTGFGFLFSLWLVYLQFFVIGEICQYCMVSAINSVFLVIFGMMLIRSWKPKVVTES